MKTKKTCKTWGLPCKTIVVKYMGTYLIYVCIWKCTTKYATKHVLQYGLTTTYRDRAYCKENEEKSTWFSMFKMINLDKNIVDCSNVGWLL